LIDDLPTRIMPGHKRREFFWSDKTKQDSTRPSKS
jgi:hypothetical protein